MKDVHSILFFFMLITSYWKDVFDKYDYVILHYTILH